MPYVYVPSSSYGGNTAPQVGGYRGPGQDPRKRRGPSKSSGQIMAELREEALQREKHLLELEKIREERRAFAKRQKEAKDAERAARQPAATQPSQAGAYYGPSSTEQPKLQEQRAYQNIQSSPTSAPTPATAPTRAPAAPKPAAAPAPVAAPTTPSVMPSAVYNPNENRNLLDVYGTLEEPSRAAISTYLNAQNRAAVNRQVRDAVAPILATGTEANKAKSTPALPGSDIPVAAGTRSLVMDMPASISTTPVKLSDEQQRARGTQERYFSLGGEPVVKSEPTRIAEAIKDLVSGISSEGLSYFNTPDWEAKEAEANRQKYVEFLGREAERARQSDERAAWLDRVRSMPIPRGLASEGSIGAPEPEIVIPEEPGYPHPLRLTGSKMADNAVGIGRSLGRAFSERFFPSYQPAEILPTSAMDPEVAALQDANQISGMNLGQMSPSMLYAAMRDPRISFMLNPGLRAMFTGIKNIPVPNLPR